MQALSETGTFDTAKLEIPDIAWQGLFKDYRDMVANTTEAADAFHFATFLQVFGCTIGRRVFVYHATKLYPNFYTCVVGRSGLTRKDTAISRGRQLLDKLHLYPEDSPNPPFKTVRGVRSYEGLLDELSGERKVRLIQLGELLTLLAKAKQDSIGNIIPALTELYDSPDLLNPPVHQKDVKPAVEPFLSIMAGTTQDWLQKALTERDIYGGFANRWLYFYSLPKPPMPNPEKVEKARLDWIASELNKLRDWADDVPSGEITITDEANKLFSDYYCQYYERCQMSGIIPTLIARVQDFVWKIALLYAVDSQSDYIEPEHLEAAIAVGKYLEASTIEVFASFGESKNKKTESRILDYLRSMGDPVPYRDCYRNLNLSSEELHRIIEPLIKIGLIGNVYEGKKRMLTAL